jgi:Flp pilus assembly protein TadD
MRSATLRNATVLVVITSGALVAGCSRDASGDGGTSPLLAGSGSAVPASLATPTVSPVPTNVPESTLEPVDAATAKAAWQDGVALFGNGDYAAASDKLKTAVAGEPQDAYRRYLLGLALWKAGDRDGAAASLVESAKLDGTRPKTWINLARVRNDLGDRNGALDAADKGLALDAGSADALHQKGRALMELNRADEALVALTTARGLDGGNGYIANTLGLLLIQRGRPADAIEPLEAAKAALPHIAYVRNNLGVAYERTGNMDEAKTEYLAAIDAGDVGGKAMRSLVRLGAKDTTTPPVDETVTAAVREPVE